MQRELDDIQRKFKQMKRNYDSMSNYAHSDKAEFAKVKAMKEEYEKVIDGLKQDKSGLLE